MVARTSRRDTRTADGRALETLRDRRVRRAPALRVYTRGSAWVAHAEDRVGSIEPGKLADVIVLSDDYLTVSEDRIPQIRSVLTIVGGKVVYESVPAN